MNADTQTFVSTRTTSGMAFAQDVGGSGADVRFNLGVVERLHALMYVGDELLEGNLPLSRWHVQALGQQSLCQFAWRQPVAAGFVVQQCEDGVRDYYAVAHQQHYTIVERTLALMGCCARLPARAQATF